MKRETPGQRAARLINNLTHTKGKFAGHSFDLRPWQRKIVLELFKTRKDGLRQYRTCLLMLPRKNGKSEIAAALAIYFLLFDGEMGAEVYSAAADKDQAALVFNVAAQMIRNDPELAAQCEIIDSQKRIVHRKSGSFYRAISAEAYSKHGFNASVVIYDELHAAPDRRLWDVLATSQGARQQPLMIAISTAGFDRHSILYQLYTYALKVRDGLVEDETFLPIIYEAPADADWQDEKVWHAANPALGDFRSLEEMRMLARRAKEMPGDENSFRQLYLNQWTQQATRAIPLHLWDENNMHPVLEGEYRGRTCYGGLDLAAVSDITAWVLSFDCPNDPDAVDLVMRCWIPESALQRGPNVDFYRQMVDAGHLETTPGDAIDYAFIRAQVIRDAQRFNIVDLNVDRLFQGQQLSSELSEEGLTVLPFGQGFASFAAPMVVFFRKLAGRQIHHGGNPVLRWMADNLVVKKDPAGNMKPDKEKSQSKVDGIVALVMALDRWDRNQAAGGVVPDPELEMV